MAAAAVSRVSGTEGVEGNVPASRAWKGNDRLRTRASVLLTFPHIETAIEQEPDLPLIDKYGRDIHDLRISVTDRCNYKCVYCRSGNDGPAFPEMPIADYLRMVRVFVGLGITKVRLTGGEPLLRRGLVEMVQELGQMRTLAGMPLDIAITTNGHLLAELAQPLADAGLSRVTVSMDAVEPHHFARITRVPHGYERVLAGIRAAQRAGLNPVKVNCVLLRGFNDDQIVGFGRFAREHGVVVRFIEFMPLEEDRVWSPEIVITLDEIVRRMADFMPLREIEHAAQRNRTSLRLRGRGGRDRNHRASVDAILRPVQPNSRDFRRQDPHLPVFSARARPRRTDGERRERRGLAEFVRRAVDQKEARHHIGEPGFVPASRTMVHIGG